MIFNEPIETMTRTQIEDLQDERLKKLVYRLYQEVFFYQRKLDEADIQAKRVSLNNLTSLPFTRKVDLRDYYPFGLFAVPLDEVSRIHASSGTTGKPTVVGYTPADIALWAELCARSLCLSGALPGQKFQNAYGYGLFTGGLGMHYGAEHMGMTVIPVSGGNTARQIMLLQDLGAQVMACTPSYALTLCDRIWAEGIDPYSLKLRTLVLGAEPWTQEMRAAIEARLPVQAINIYGLSEVIGPGVSNECFEAKDGSHVFEDHFIVECIDPNSGETLAEGQVGELVFTTLTKQATPLLRYRTGDLASLNRQTCKCGRSHTRHTRIIGRVDDMLIIRGINVYPSQIEAALVGVPELSPHHQLVLHRTEHLDQLEVRVEVSAGFDLVDRTAVAALESQVKAHLKEALGLTVKLALATPESLPRSEGGKLARVLDQRGA